MRVRAVIGVVALILVGAWLSSGRSRLAAQGAAALSGIVSSQEEGKMEGVVVTGRREGANFTVSVVSDVQGRYSFPRTHLEPGKYAVSIRAVGYDLAGAATVDVTAGKAATLDLKLQKAKDLATELTSLDWAMIMPGTPEQRDKLVYQPMSCNYCHSYRRIVKSKHDVAGLVSAMTRMKTYYVDGTASSDDGRGRFEKWTTFGDSTGRPTPTVPTQGGLGTPFWPYTQPKPIPMTEFAEYLATVNLGGGRTTWPYELKATLPRPTGKGTRVIITQWDMPRKDTVAHDSAIDAQGNLWYGDESGTFVGMLNPKTNTFKEYPLGPVPPETLHGSRDPEVDEEGNVWFPMRLPGGAAYLTRLDPKTGLLTTIDGASAQFIQRGPGNKMWALGTGTPTIRVDIKTMKIDGTFKTVSGYQKVLSSKEVVCGASDTAVNCLDTRTGMAKSWPLPSGPNAYGRRGKIDDQDRYWFAEYSKDRIAMFDTRTEKIQEWPLRKYATPYTSSVPDKNGYVYAPSNMSDRVMRLDPKTGDVVEYLMPTELDTKEMQLDPSSPNRTVVLFANTRNARVVRVEPLD